jgi:hypothetical protein
MLAADVACKQQWRWAQQRLYMTTCHEERSEAAQQ